MSWCRLSFCLIAAFAAGCGDSGPPKGTVEGKVTIGGAPPTEKAIVYFINSTIGSGGAAQIGEDGSYEINEPMLVGEYTIYFERIVESDGPVSTAQEQLQAIPREYRTEASSPLKKQVDAGKNEIDIDVPKAE